MKTGEIIAEDFQDYYEQLYHMQAEAHDEEYMLVHQEIKRLMAECDSYAELGVKQGATLAAAMLMKPKVAQGYDWDLDWYNKVSHHFEFYAAKHNIDLKVEARDSLKFSLPEPVDVLYIDTKHTYNQCMGELAKHAHMVKKYIVFHDSWAEKGIHQAVETFTSGITPWVIVKDVKINVGFMTISRV